LSGQRRPRDKQFAERAAPRYWLSTDGKGIVMRRLAITDMAAKVTADRWIREAGPAVAKLAEYVAAADKRGGRSAVSQRCDADARAGEEGSELRTIATVWAHGRRLDEVAYS